MNPSHRLALRGASVATFFAMLIASSASAKVIVGDKPQLKTRAMDGSSVDLATYAGKMILVDFFGKSDMSQRHVEIIQDLYKKNADKGLVVVGICVERKPADATE